MKNLKFNLDELKLDVQGADEVVILHFADKCLDKDISYEVEELIDFAQEMTTLLPSILEESKELNRLFDKQYERIGIATKLWQKAHNSENLPDLGDLVDWLLKLY